MSEEMDLLDFIKYVLGCECMSDLQTHPYNNRAKLILDKLDLREYSLHQIRDAVEYIYSK